MRHRVKKCRSTSSGAYSSRGRCSSTRAIRRFASSPSVCVPSSKRYWAVEWDLPDGESYQTATLSEPTIHLSFEFGSSRRAHVDGPGAWVTGPVTKRRFDVGIFGRGAVFGVNFQPGATLAFSDQKPASIRDSTVPAELWFPRLDDDLGLSEMFAQSQRAGTPDFSELAASVESWLLSWRPQVTPVVRTAEAGSRSCRSRRRESEDPRGRTDIGERTLQRMFSSFCGSGEERSGQGAGHRRGRGDRPRVGRNSGRPRCAFRLVRSIALQYGLRSRHRIQPCRVRAAEVRQGHSHLTGDSPRTFGRVGARELKLRRGCVPAGRRSTGRR